MYREGFPAGAAIQLNQHLGIAEDQVDMIDHMPEWLATQTDGRGMTNEVMAGMALRWAQGWERCWQQLEEARALVAAQGRDLHAYDAARSSAGDIWNDVAKGRAVSIGNQVHVKWQNTPTTPARAAIMALRSAVPEAVASAPAPIGPVDLAPSSNTAIVVVVVLAAIGIAIWVLSHLPMK